MVSIIVPVYNTEKYIRCCVESILAQTFTDFELILVDDGSSDDCPVICDEYTTKDSRVRVIHQKNAGQAAARNRAVEEACGEWVCFVDSDDMIHPQMIEILYNAVIENDVDISMCSVLETDEIPEHFFCTRNPKQRVLETSEGTFEWMYDTDDYRCWIVCCKLVRRPIVVEYPFTEGRIFEDNALVCKWFSATERVVDINEQLYFYRVNLAGTTKSGFSMKKLDYLWAVEERIKLFASLGYDKILSRECNRYLLAASDCYHRTKNQLEDIKTANLIRDKMKKVIMRYYKLVSLSYDSKERIYACVWPKTVVVVSNIKAIISTIRQSGAKGLYQKVASKIKLLQK